MVHDHRAQFVVEACADAGLRIPEDIALIGMDNDEIICEHSVPTISSVSGNSEQVGYETLALLDRMMQGEPPPTEDVLVTPDRVVARQSTDRQYFSDPLVQRSVDFVRENIHRAVSVTTLAEHLGISRRTLEVRFRQSVQNSPHEFFNGMRVEHAQALLRKPQKRTVEQLSRDCGFGTVASFYGAFKRFTGQSPAAYRRAHTVRRPASRDG